MLPAEAEDEVRRWAGNPGLEIFGYSAGNANWIHVPTRATFRFRRHALRVDAFLERDADPASIRDLYERSVLPLVLQAEGRQVLHASAVHDGRSVIAFAGVSRSGKSTLAYALAQRGFALWADDAVAFFLDGDASALMAVPLPFTSRLRPSAKLALERSPQELASPAPPNDAPIACILLLRPDDTATTAPEIQRVRPAEAFAALLPHAYCFSLADRTRNREFVDDYLRLVERVPVWSLSFPRRLANLPQISRELERFAASALTTE